MLLSMLVNSIKAHDVHPFSRPAVKYCWADELDMRRIKSLSLIL